jgi:gamma-glutamyl hercynylcysteine S-oxide synthase
MDLNLEIRAVMERARAATNALLDPVSDAGLVAQVSPLQSPLVWDFAHAAYFEELWILRTAKGDPPIAQHHDAVYDAFKHERRERSKLPALRPDAARAYAEDVRERALAWLEHVDFDQPNALLRNGFVFGLVIQHELQHQETMLQTLQLKTDVEYPIPDAPAPDRAPGGPSEIRVPGGTFTLGAVNEPWAYDNELPAIEVELPPFRIDRAPVTNGQFMEFIADRGYRTPKLWADAGWEWRQEEGVSAPLFWERAPEGWERTRFGRREPVPPWEPVQHVSWYEADAFARWAGKRLPTEVEWERAAGWHHREGKQHYPWGLTWTGFEASLDHRRFSPAPAGSYAGGVSPVGCVQMAGDVWEWTSSTFEPYPDFVAFPYPEYSEVFFGDEYRVLRGGSWATDGLVARTSFRNWDYPQRRQIFAGLRCARNG